MILKETKNKVIIEPSSGCNLISFMISWLAVSARYLNM
jgi:hypothetical protein